MLNTRTVVEAMAPSDLLATTRNLVRHCAGLEAELLIHLGEIDHRKLYLDCACPSMFVFCVQSYGFSEDVACTRIAVARSARDIPAILDSVRSGAIHLTGLRLLLPHLTVENHRDVLGRAAGKSKREIEELIACLCPQPPVPTIVRKLPERVAPGPDANTALAFSAETPASPLPTVTPPPTWTVPPQHRPTIAPLSEQTYKFQFTSDRDFHDMFRHAQNLLRHRVPDGDPVDILKRALKLLIEDVEKERFATGRKPRDTSTVEDGAVSRHIPAWIRRLVVERDGGRCTFVAEDGSRCPETGFLEFDHDDGFARVRVHDPARIHLRCRAHNQHAAEKMYGRAFMEEKRVSRASPIRPGTDTSAQLFFDPVPSIPSLSPT